jgi:hypothetical protein
MTAIQAWITKDNHGFASLYLASDSRVSLYYPRSKKFDVESDSGTKTFASESTPDIFAACGTIGSEERLRRVVEALGKLLPTIRSTIGLKCSGSAYSLKVKAAIYSSKPAIDIPEGLIVFHGYRFGTQNFGLVRFAFAKVNNSLDATVTTYRLSSSTGLIRWDGTGGQMVRETRKHYTRDDAYGFSRWLWQIFCASLKDPSDPRSGGPPQLVGLYRSGNGVRLGVFFEARASVAGKEPNPEDASKMEFRDGLFQRVDIHGNRLKGAQIHSPIKNSER